MTNMIKNLKRNIVFRNFNILIFLILVVCIIKIDVYAELNKETSISIKYYNKNASLIGKTLCSWTPEDGKFGCKINITKTVEPEPKYRFTGWGPGGSAWGASTFGTGDGSCTAGRMGEVTLYTSTNFYPCFVPESQDPNVTKVTVGYVDQKGKIYDSNYQYVVENFASCTYDSTKSKSCTLNLPTPNNVSGYTFTGWSEVRNCYYGEMSPKVSYDTLLHACWLPNDSSNSFYINYDANGGTGAPINQGYNKLDYIKPAFYSLTPFISDIIPTRIGYKFLGWSTEKNATTATWFPGDLYFDNKTIDLYAVWKKKKSTDSQDSQDSTDSTYTIKYDSNGGADAPKSQSQSKGDITISSSKPTREGYNFLGWSTDKNATSPEYKPGDKYTGNASITLYAVWQEKTSYNFPVIMAATLVVGVVVYVQSKH